MANTKRKLPVWAIILYVFTALVLLAGVGIMIFGFINSATILPYKRQNILEYFSDEASYYTVSGTVEDVSLGEAENGAYPLEVTLKDVTSEEEGINERGIVTFTLPQETYFLLSGNGFFTALAEGAEAEFYMAWNVWGNVEIAAFTEVSVNGTSYLEAAESRGYLLDWVQNDLE